MQGYKHIRSDGLNDLGYASRIYLLNDELAFNMPMPHSYKKNLGQFLSINGNSLVKR